MCIRDRLIITSTGDVLFNGINISDLEWPWTPIIGVCSDFCDFCCRRVNWDKMDGHRRKLPANRNCFTLAGLMSISSKFLVQCLFRFSVALWRLSSDNDFRATCHHAHVNENHSNTIYVKILIQAHKHAPDSVWWHVGRSMSQPVERRLDPVPIYRAYTSLTIMHCCSKFKSSRPILTVPSSVGS